MAISSRLLMLSRPACRHNCRLLSKAAGGRGGRGDWEDRGCTFFEPRAAMMSC